MDKFWDRVSERIEDLEVVKQRIARQWNVVQNILLHDIPKDLQAFFRLQTLSQQVRLSQILGFAHHNLQNEWAFIEQNFSRFSEFSINYLHHRWRQLQPKLDNLVQTSFAISTATSTLQLTVQITPIVLSALTILATAPMLNMLLPEFLFNTTVIFFIMVGISAYAGYSKFKELELRAKLDGQIEINHKQNKRHSQQLRRLEKRLKELEHSLTSFQSTPLLVTPAFPLVTQQQIRSISQKSNDKTPESTRRYRKASLHRR